MKTPALLFIPVFASVGCSAVTGLQLLSQPAEARASLDALQFASLGVRPGQTLQTGRDQATTVEGVRVLLQDQARDCPGLTLHPTANSLTANLGDNCVISGVDASGAVAVTVVDVAPATVQLQTQQLVVNGEPLDGQVTATAVAANAMDVQLDVARGDMTQQGLIHVTMEPSNPPTFTFNGTVDSTRNGVTTQVRLDGVQWTLGEQQPHAGSIVVGDGMAIQLDPAAAG